MTSFVIQCTLDKYKFVLKFIWLATVYKIFTYLQKLYGNANNANFGYYEKNLERDVLLLVW